ncbi:DMT family transporter [Rhodohalobacter sp. 8-1]|uniref:DMT family transporter n=1 Tax=Rhodohalobacter sp. 8-1 TaxID=3131972 RepID=UPI0030EF706B
MKSTLKARLPFTDVTLFTVAIIWALNFSVVKASLSEVDIYSFNSVRFILAAGLIWSIILWKDKKVYIPRSDWLPLLGVGLIGNVLYQWLFIVGIDLTLSANAAVMLGTIPIWIAIFSHLFTDEKMTSLKAIGVVLAFAGVAFIVSGGANPLSLASATFRGDLIIVCAAITWAVFTILSKGFLRRYSALHFSGIMTSIGAVLLTGMSFLSAETTQWELVSAGAWGGMIYSGALSIGLAYLIWNNGIVSVGPVKTSVYQNLVPVLGLLFGIVLLNESLSTLQYIGAAIVVTGIVMTRRG